MKILQPRRFFNSSDKCDFFAIFPTCWSCTGEMQHTRGLPRCMDMPAEILGRFFSRHSISRMSIVWLSSVLPLLQFFSCFYRSLSRFFHVSCKSCQFFKCVFSSISTFFRESCSACHNFFNCLAELIRNFQYVMLRLLPRFFPFTSHSPELAVKVFLLADKTCILFCFPEF